jgi:putative ABC transport system permease protein
MKNDLRQALRALARRPGLSLAVLLILALGIGSTTTIFSITSSVLLSAVPYKDGDRLVALGTLIENDGGVFPVSYLDAETWRERSRTLELLSVSSATSQLNLTAGGFAERIGVGFVSASYFDLLGWRPLYGRTLLPEDENRTSPPAVAVLGHGLWKRRFGGDPAIVGKDIQLQGLSFRVVGILPEVRDIFPDIDLYVPVTVSRLVQREGYVEDRSLRWLQSFARLRPGATIEQARQEMLGIARELGTSFPDSNEGTGVSVEPLRSQAFDVEKMRLSILTLLIGAVFVLLVGCANVTNLLLIRAVERRKEVALRLALGITRLRLIRHFVLEGGLLCLGGAVLGIGAAFFAVRLLARLGTAAYDLPAFIQFAVDLRALGAAVVLSCLISLVIGVIPARRSLQVDVREELQSEGKGHTHSAATAFTRSFLVVSAVFFSVVLLVGAGLMIRSLASLMKSDPGLRVDHVLSARFELPPTRYTTDEPAFVLYRKLIEEARTLPGVESVGVWGPGVPGSSTYIKFIVPEGRSLESQEDKVRVYEHRISPGLLQEMGIRRLAGRDFTPQDDARKPLVTVVSRSTAEGIWPSQDPIGKRFWVGPPHSSWAEVVGVVADADQRGRLASTADFRRDVYFPLFQMRSRTNAIVLRLRGEARPNPDTLNRIVQAIDPEIPVYDVKTLQERRRDEESGVRLNTSLLIFFAASALALAVIGIYSILVYTVRQQSFEIGIRMALGADRSEIVRHFVWKGAALLGIGLLTGLAGAFALAKTMASLLYNMSPYDPLVFLAVPCVIALCALPAILRPAVRATRVDPSSLFRLN